MIEPIPLLIALVFVLIVMIGALIYLNLKPAEIEVEFDTLPEWAFRAIAAAYNVAIDQLKETGELPSGAARHSLAMGYYETIPEAQRTFSADEFAVYVESMFEVVDWGATLLKKHIESR